MPPIQSKNQLSIFVSNDKKIISRQ